MESRSIFVDINLFSLCISIYNMKYLGQETESRIGDEVNKLRSEMQSVREIRLVVTEMHVLTTLFYFNNILC